MPVNCGCGVCFNSFLRNSLSLSLFFLAARRGALRSHSPYLQLNTWSRLRLWARTMRHAQPVFQGHHIQGLDKQKRYMTRKEQECENHVPTSRPEAIISIIAWGVDGTPRGPPTLSEQSGMDYPLCRPAHSKTNPQDFFEKRHSW